MSSKGGSAGIAKKAGTTITNAASKTVKALTKNNVAAAGILVTFLIAISLSIEFGTEFIEHHLGQKHLLPFVYHCYKAIMLLGVSSAALFVEDQFKVFDKLVPGRGFNPKLMGALHMMLFLTMVFYLTIMGILLAFTFWYANGLKKMDNKDKTAKEKEYNAMRLKFMQEHSLPEDFAFFVYMRKQVREKVMDIAGIPASIWTIILLVVALSTASLYGNSKFSMTTCIASEFITYSWVTMFLAAATFAKQKKVVSEIIKNHGGGGIEKGKNSKKKGKGGKFHSMDEEEHHNILAGAGEGAQNHSKEAQEQEKLFFMGKPWIHARCIQLVVMLEACLLPVWTLYLAGAWAEYPPVDAWMLNLSTALPHTLTLFFFLPQALQGYIVSQSIGALYSEDTIEEALHKTPSWLKENAHLLHHHAHAHDHAAVLTAKLVKPAHGHGGGGHGHGGGGHGHGGGGHDDHGHDDHGHDDHGHGGHDDDEHGGGDHHGHSEPKRRSSSKQRDGHDHH